MKILKLTLSIILFGLSFGFSTAQTSDTEFTDKDGNNFTIPIADLIPKPLTNTFLIENFDGTYFKSQPLIADLKFDYYISEFEKINRNNFKFKIDQHPKTEDIRTKLGYMGSKYFKVKIKRNKDGIELVKIEYLYSVI